MCNIKKRHQNLVLGSLADNKKITKDDVLNKIKPFHVLRRQSALLRLLECKQDSTIL